MKNASARKKRAEAHTVMKAKALSCAILFAKDSAFFVRGKAGHSDLCMQRGLFSYQNMKGRGAQCFAYGGIFQRRGRLSI